MTEEVKVCPFMSNSEGLVDCIKERCRAYRKLSEEKYETSVDGNYTRTTTIKGICLLIPGDDYR